MLYRVVFTVSLSLGLAACSSQPTAQQSTPPASTPAAPAATEEESRISLALSAAPADVSANAAVVDMGEDGQMRELRPGTNGWVCMARPEVMCVDKEWHAFVEAWMNKKDPQVKSVGIGYMLQGDKGASNTDPFATAPTPDNQWVVSPPHIMVITPNVAQLGALPTDPQNGGPWVMWKGTNYAHIMVPVTAMSESGINR